MTSRRAYFDALYEVSDDPYQLRTRWYEARKRAVLLSALPAPRYRSAFEPGCGTGELTAALAPRCDQLLASDFQPSAVRVAKQRTAAWPHVRVVQQTLPADWPDARSVPMPATPPDCTGVFDLIVLSEVGYFLDARAMALTAQRCLTSLAPDGTLVACDWLPAFRERVLPTHRVQALLGALGLANIVTHQEADFSLQVWSRDARSVATREGLF